MLRLFTENRILSVFLLPIFIIVHTILNSYFSFFEVTNNIDLGLFGNHTLNSILPKQIIGGTLIFINSLGINYIFNHNNLFEKNTYLPSCIYIVWMSFFEGMYNPDGFIISHTACIVLFYQLFKLNQNEDGRRIVFNASFFAGIATCFHLPMVILLPFLFVMVWTIRPFVLRESLLIIAGFLTPLVYAGAYILIKKEPFISLNWKLENDYYLFNQLNLLLITVVGLFYVVISVFGIRSKLQKSSIRFRKLVRILWLFFFLFICIGFVDFLITEQLKYFSLIFIILSFFSFFAFIKKPLSTLTNGLFILLIIGSFLKFFLP